MRVQFAHGHVDWKTVSPFIHQYKVCYTSELTTIWTNRSAQSSPCDVAHEDAVSCLRCPRAMAISRRGPWPNAEGRLGISADSGPSEAKCLRTPNAGGTRVPCQGVVVRPSSRGFGSLARGGGCWPWHGARKWPGARTWTPQRSWFPLWLSC